MENEENKVNVEEEKKEVNCPKKKNNWLFTLFACVMTAIIVILAMNIGNKAAKIVNSDEKGSKNTSNISSNASSNETSNETSNVEKTTTSTGVNIYDLAQVNMILPSSYADTIYTSILNKVNGSVSSLSNDDKLMLLYFTAVNYNIMKSISGEEYDLCSAGAGACNAIEVTDFKELEKLYGLSDDYTSLVKSELIYKDKNNKEYILFTYGGFAIEEQIGHNYSISASGNDIVVVDKMIITNTTTNQSKNLTREYTFKLNNEGYYYLSSIVTK